MTLDPEIARLRGQAVDLDQTRRGALVEAAQLAVPFGFALVGWLGLRKRRRQVLEELRHLQAQHARIMDQPEEQLLEPLPDDEGVDVDPVEGFPHIATGTDTTEFESDGSYQARIRCSCGYVTGWADPEDARDVFEEHLASIETDPVPWPDGD